MKRKIAILLLALASFSFAGEESAADIAKRVIADQSSAYTPMDRMPMGVVPKPPARKPEEIQLADAARRSHAAIISYMLSDAVPEKTRIAYAITVLAGKRIQEPFSQGVLMGGSVDVRKNEGYLKDGLILAVRLAEIEKTESGGADQPATAPESEPEGNEKPKPESEGRAR